MEIDHFEFYCDNCGLGKNNKHEMAKFPTYPNTFIEKPNIYCVKCNILMKTKTVFTKEVTK